MTNTLKENPAVALALQAFIKFKGGSLDLAGLGSTLSSAVALLENSIPQAVQKAIERADNEIESIRFTVDTKDHASAVERVRAELEAAVAKS